MCQLSALAPSYPRNCIPGLPLPPLQVKDVFRLVHKAFQSSFNIVSGTFWPPLPPNEDSEKWGDGKGSLDQVFHSLPRPFPTSLSPSAGTMGPSALQFCQYTGGRLLFRCLLPRGTCSRASTNPPGTAPRGGPRDPVSSSHQMLHGMGTHLFMAPFAILYIPSFKSKAGLACLPLYQRVGSLWG